MNESVSEELKRFSVTLLMKVQILLEYLITSKHMLAQAKDHRPKIIIHERWERKKFYKI